MAQLNDSIITGSLRVTDDVTANSVQTDKVKAPTTSGGSTYGVGSNGQVLKSNGTTVYWADDAGSTPYTGTAPISVNASTNVITHDTSGATAGSYGDSSAQTPAFEGSFKVPYVTVDNKGHVTGISDHDVTLPQETAYSLSQSPNYLNNLIFSKTPSAGGGAVTESLYIPTIVRGTMNNDSSSSTAFVVNAPSAVNILYDGLTFIIKNTKVASASGCTLNINSLGAKRIWTSQSNGYCTTHWGLNQTYLFVYDATNDRFELQQGRDTDGNDTYTLRPYYTRVMASGNGLKKYSLFARLSGTASASTESVSMDLNLFSSFTSDSGTGTKTYTNNVFDMTKIFYLNSSSDVASGSRSSDNTVSYEAVRVDLRYTFNITTSTLTARKPVYLVFLATSALQPNYGQLANTINSGFPVYTQDIGATLTAVHADSTLEAYIARLRFVYLGIAEDGYRMDLLIDNPSYMPNPTVIDANKWKSLVSPTRGSVIYSSMRANADEDGNNIKSTYAKNTNVINNVSLTQDNTDGHILYWTVVNHAGSASVVYTIPDNNTTYSMSRDGESVKLTPSSGSAQTVSLSNLITGLSVGTSNSQKDDYLITQYAGGGSSNNNYYRRKVANVVNEAIVKNALSAFIYTKNTTGTIQSGTSAYGYVTNNTYMYFNIPLDKMLDPSISTITFNKLPVNIRYDGGYYFPTNYVSGGYDLIANDSGGGLMIARRHLTMLEVRIYTNAYTGVPKASANNIPLILRIDDECTMTFS